MNLQITLSAEVHPSEGQWLEEQLIIEKWGIFTTGTRIPTIQRTEKK
jgi:hypothetical protein